MKELVKTKVYVDQLRVGMKVVELDRPWLETDFLLQGFVIQDQQDIEALVRQCEFVFIEGVVSEQGNYERRSELKGLAMRSGPKKSAKKKDAEKIPGKPPEKKVSYINKVSFEREMTVARGTYDSARSLAKNIMEGIRVGRAIDMHQARATVDAVVDSILRNNNALMWLSKLKEKDEYTAEHCLNVCILGVTFARHMGYEENEIRKVGLCGLLHDVGKARIPVEVLNKPGRHNDDEFVMMKQHPSFGRNLLMSLPNSEHVAVDVAYSHHERLAGKGYPRGLEARQISYYSRMIALVDAYDAITSNRCYDKGRASMEALDIIYKNKGSQFDRELALEFIKCIGIYPPGSIVELTNGEVGIVISENTESKLRPRIILVLDKLKKWRREKVINLADSAQLDPDGNHYMIAHEVPDGTYGIEIRTFIEKGLLLRQQAIPN